MGTRAKRVRRREGDLLTIDLQDGRHCYAQVALEPLIVLFEGAHFEALAAEGIARLPVLFRLWVMNHAVTRGTWPVIGRQPLAPENTAQPFFYKQDIITGRLSLHHSSFADTNYERPATLAECYGLESAAVWEPEHVIDRLQDHFAGRPNKWVDSLKIDVSAIPTG